jgi:hypothetical protein
VNGVELKRGILEAGDALELGDVRLRFVGAGKVFRSGADQSQQLSAVGTFESVAPSVQGARLKSSGVSLGKLGLPRRRRHLSTRAPATTSAPSTSTSAIAARPRRR